MNKYLIIAPSWVGDMVMSQSLYRYLKICYPDCSIDIAAPKHCAELAKFMPEVNQAHILEFKHGEFGFFVRRKMAKSFKGKGYTHAIILPNSWKSALIPFFSAIKKRTGWHGEERFILLNDRRRLNKKQYPLMIERFCALAIEKKVPLPNVLPYPKFVLKSDQARLVFDRYQLDSSQRIIALCPGAEFGPAKKWPTRYYLELAQYFIKNDYQVLLLGSPKDADSTKEIAVSSKGKNIYDLAGKTSLEDAVYLLSACEHVVSNDSGLMHIACAVDVPVTVIYGSTSDKFTPPLSKKAQSLFIEDLPCRPCFKRTCPFGHMKCMNDLTPDKVIQHFERQQQARES